MDSDLRHRSARSVRLLVAILLPALSACVDDRGDANEAPPASVEAKPVADVSSTTAPPASVPVVDETDEVDAVEDVVTPVEAAFEPVDPETDDLPSDDAQFREGFDDNTGLDRFRYGVYHRDGGNAEAGLEPTLSGWNNSHIGGEWTGDHDANCGGPDTQRPLRSDFKQDTTGANDWLPWVNFRVEDLVYVCKDHMMTSMGDIAAYSVVWFSPDMTFDSVTEVSFDVNLTDLGPRQWIKWGVVSDTLFESTYMTNVPTPGFLLSDIGSSDLGPLPGPGRVIATWSGAGTESGVHGVGVNGVRIGTANPTPEDKAKRHPVNLIDNGDGTITVSVAGQGGIVDGSFPECPCRVVFYDHNYTPDKDGEPIGHTWHWDNIVVR